MARQTTMTGAWLALATAFGGVGKLAEACGKNRSTIERWASGDFVPDALTQQAVNTMAAANGVPGPFKVTKADVANLSQVDQRAVGALKTLEGVAKETSEKARRPRKKAAVSS